MDHKEVLKRVDHTLLTQAATWEESRPSATRAWPMRPRPCAFPPLCEAGADYVKNRLKICTVVASPTATPPRR